MTETTASEPTDGQPPRKPVQLNDVDDYEDLIASHDLVLLEFVTSGCGICGSMEPVLGVVARSAPGVVATVNAGLVPELAAEFDVQSVPTLVVLRDDEEVVRFDDGFQPAETLVDALETHATR
ncbi:thioredoxin family protein [Natrialba sp. PRR66]|uniref:thioredoxin family protein n=1 Tax=Natrialba sp. PRR66 TaxID=3098146 RepID=UPI002B1E7E0B|nr:thioredoxin family protein [Natrialba sp. PRR66]